MIKFSDLKVMGTRTIGKSVLMTKNYSPEVLTVVGIVGIVTASVLACRATMKLETTVDKVHDGLEVAKDRKQLADYTSLDDKKAVTYVYTRGVVDLTKLYAPSVILGSISIACIVGANGILRKRNLALVAAYKAIESSYSEYRKRVVEEYGEEKDLDYRRGLHVEKIKDKNGQKRTLVTVDPNGISKYARFFDEQSVNWDKTPEYNLLFVRQQQNLANDYLHAKGHIFLNEVYDLLGIPRSKAGQVVGWFISPDGDNYVDFGIYDFMNVKAREFVNGYEQSILLDFNVDGVIYDKL